MSGLQLMMALNSVIAAQGDCYVACHDDIHVMTVRAYCDESYRVVPSSSHLPLNLMNFVLSALSSLGSNDNTPHSTGNNC